jgi:hypothetical protein
MGAKTCLLAICDRDPREVLREVIAGRHHFDREATRLIVQQLTPGARVSNAGDGNLAEDSNPEDGLCFAAAYPGLVLLCDARVALDKPSMLPSAFTRARGQRVYSHAMHSVVDWLAFSVWEDGTLVRALSLSPDTDVLENVGAPMPFERSYWAGDHRLDDDYPLPFHPLELGEDALLAFFGFHLEGEVTDIDPFEVPLAGFQITS